MDKVYQTRVMYFRDKANHPVGALVMQRIDTGSKRLVKYQFSVSSEEKAYNKTLGAKIATNRLSHPRTNAPCLTLDPAVLTAHDITACVMQDIIANLENPTKARNAAKLWLKKRAKLLSK
jgi:hypothetical protein